MQLYYENQDLDAWKTEVNKYQKQRKELGFQQKPTEIVSHWIIKRKEREFDPVLQTYADDVRDQKEKQFRQSKYKQRQDYMKNIKDNYQYNYDIISTEMIENNPNLKHKPDFDEERKKKMMFKNVSRSESVDQKLHKKVSEFSRKYKYRDINLVSNRYFQNHDNIYKKEQEEMRDSLYDRKNRMLDYNSITSSFYNEEKEKKFQEGRKEQQKEHGKDYNKMYPPSWKYKEMAILDPTKPIPDELKIVDQRREVAQRPYKLKHELDKEYRERGMMQQDMQKIKALNKYNQNKYVEEYAKGYDLINNQKVDKKLEKSDSLWSQIQRSKDQHMLKRQETKTSSNIGGMLDTKSSQFRSQHI